MGPGTVLALTVCARFTAHFFGFPFLTFAHLAITTALRARALAPLPSISNLEQALLLLTNDLQKQVTQLICG